MERDIYYASMEFIMFLIVSLVFIYLHVYILDTSSLIVGDIYNNFIDYFSMNITITLIVFDVLGISSLLTTIVSLFYFVYAWKNDLDYDNIVILFLILLVIILSAYLSIVYYYTSFNIRLF